MCFDLDSRPPIAPIAGGSLDSGELSLEGPDGNRFSAWYARAAEPIGAGMIVLPDVRGLHPYYEDLALRFAEHGVDAVAIDYFGRTAGMGRRDATFDYAAHVPQTSIEGLRSDVIAAAQHLRGTLGTRALFTIGFCFGGRLAYLSTTFGLGLSGAVAFYGWPVGPAKNGSPAPVDVADRMAGSVLGIFGGADQGIPASAIAQLETTLQHAGVDHRLVTYENAPHSFFDRKADEFVRSSEAAWGEVLEFVRSRTAQPEAR
jgi:carboxymethylenebutenolidase